MAGGTPAFPAQRALGVGSHHTPLCHISNMARARRDTLVVIPTALPKFVNVQDSNPPLSRGERAGSGGILHAQQFVNFARAIGKRLCSEI
jgi:hypothetical protein